MEEIRDLSDCELKTEEDLVQILQQLHHKHQNYVHAGDVLVSINSWKDTENFEDEITNFIKLAKVSRNSLPPHVFTVAENALENARKGNRNVAIIPLGESGSGKSRNIEFMLHYLSRRSLARDEITKEIILSINSILASFCNAKTLICNNSTRCIKLYEIFFDDKTDDVIGVHLQICFLEKFRVVSQINNENNFHIFHEILSGLSPEQLNRYFLYGNHRYVSMNREAFVGNEEENPLNKNIMCLKKLDFVQEEIDCIFAVLAAIILLGDLEFGQSKKRNVPVIVNGDILQKVETLLGVPSSALLSLIIVHSKSSRSSKINAASSIVKAMYERDYLAMVLYETLVMGIESRINRKYSKSSQYSIFLLDAFGWENYNINFFEQLCINITNDTLQSAYNNIIFSQCQMELEQEDIFLGESYKDYDQPGPMPFVFKPKGLLDVLDMTTESKVKINDHMLLKKMNTAFKNQSCYMASNSDFRGFIIRHFIGQVTYDINGFLAKSLCRMNTDVLACFKSSKNKVLSHMIQERFSRENSSSSDRDIPARHASLKRRSLYENEWLKTDVFLSCRQKKKKKVVANITSNISFLTTTLTSVLNRLSFSNVHFIRCIKINKHMEPNNFDYERTLHQVRWSGLLPTAQSRSGFLKMKATFSEFISRYKIIFFHLSRSIEPSSEVCLSALSKSFDDTQFRIGKTKIFMSSFLVYELERKLQKIFSQIVFIQKVFRGQRGRQEFAKLKKIKNKYDIERSTFYSQLSADNIQFRDHLSLQIMEDRRRLKNSRLQEEQKKFQKEPKTEKSKSPPSRLSRSTSYIFEGKVINDEISQLSTWCTVVCYQRTQQLAEFYVQEAKVVIDGTRDTFTTDRIGFNSFPTASNDAQVTRVKSCIGRGVQLSQTEDGSLIALRLCKNPIFVKGYYCEEKLVEAIGELEKQKEMKIFDFERFAERVNYDCNPARVDNDTQDRCLQTCVVHISFVKNSDSDEDSPCWVEVGMTKATDYVYKSISSALEQRRKVQEKIHFQKPPALRIGGSSKMESVSANALKLIRPSHYIETVKFNRKAWARKRVQSNPFLYGVNYSSPDEISPGKISRSKSASSSISCEPPSTSRSSIEKEKMEGSQKLKKVSSQKPSEGTLMEERNGNLEYSFTSPEIPSPNNQSVVRATTQHPQEGIPHQVSSEQRHSGEQRQSPYENLSFGVSPLSTSSKVSHIEGEGHQRVLPPTSPEERLQQPIFHHHSGELPPRPGHQRVLPPTSPEVGLQQPIFHHHSGELPPHPGYQRVLPPTSPEERLQQPIFHHHSGELPPRPGYQRVLPPTSPEERLQQPIFHHHSGELPPRPSHQRVLPPTSPEEGLQQPIFLHQLTNNNLIVDDYQEGMERNSNSERSSAVSPPRKYDALTQNFRHQMSFPRS